MMICCCYCLFYSPESFHWVPNLAEWLAGTPQSVIPEYEQLLLGNQVLKWISVGVQKGELKMMICRVIVCFTRPQNFQWVSNLAEQLTGTPQSIIPEYEQNYRVTVGFKMDEKVLKMMICCCYCLFYPPQSFHCVPNLAEQLTGTQQSIIPEYEQILIGELGFKMDFRKENYPKYRLVVVIVCFTHPNHFTGSQTQLNGQQGHHRVLSQSMNNFYQGIRF